MKRQIKAFLIHFLFWIVSYFALVQVFAFELPATKVDYVYTILFHLFLVVGVYLNIYFTIQRYLKKQRWIPFLICFFLAVGIMVLIYQLTFTYFSEWLFPEYFFISYWNSYEIALFAFAYLFLSTLLVIFSDWISQVHLKNRLLELEKQKRNFELEALKSQINPHFLFNSLNNLYGLIQQNSDRSARFLLKLSGMLRYVLYEVETDRIPLAKELGFLDDYIALYKIRYSKARITIEKHIQDMDFLVPPLLFLPLIENAFIHGAEAEGFDRVIDIQIKSDAASLSFSIKNPYKSKTRQGEPGGGIGLENIAKRLDILYQEKAFVSNYTKNGIFNVHLEIKL